MLSMKRRPSILDIKNMTCTSLCTALWAFSAKMFCNWVSNGDVANGGNCKHTHQGVKIALL